MARARPSGKEKIFTHFMQAPDFELTHNRDNSYPAVAPHYHEFYELIFFLSGHVSYIVGDRSMKLEPGDMLIIPPNTLHNPIFEDFRQRVLPFLSSSSVSTPIFYSLLAVALSGAICCALSAAIS